MVTMPVMAAAAARFTATVMAAAIAAASAAFVSVRTCRCKFFKGRGSPQFDGHTEQLINGTQNFIDALARFKESMSQLVVNHSLPEAIEFRDFFFRRRHAGLIFGAKLLAISVDVMEKPGRFGTAGKKIYPRLGGRDLLVRRKSIAKHGSQFHQFRSERRFGHTKATYTAKNSRLQSEPLAVHPYPDSGMISLCPRVKMTDLR